MGEKLTRRDIRQRAVATLHAAETDRLRRDVDDTDAGAVPGCTTECAKLREENARVLAANRDMIDWCGSAREDIARLERASRTRPDYDLRCTDCGASHYLDTSLPSDVWNQIAESGDLLCALCIDERLTKAGLRCDEAEFYYVGTSLSGKSYTESHGTVASLRADAEAVRAVEEWKAAGPDTREIVWGLRVIAWELPEPGADWDADSRLIAHGDTLADLGRALVARRQEEGQNK